MKVFLTGSSGILGTDIQSELEKENHEVLGFNSQNIRLGNRTEVEKKVCDFKPDVLIHSAAMTNVDLCEDDKDAAVEINITGSNNMAIAAAKNNIPIVYISSCGVYGNKKKSAYTELDEPEPITYHHYTKFEGEKKVREISNFHLIIRPGWLFGGTQNHQKNFVEARRKEALLNPVMKSAADKFGSPTYTLDLAKQIIKLLDINALGTYNLVNTEPASRFEYIAQILLELGYTNTLLPVDSKAFPRRANMPDNEVLENYNLSLLKGQKMRTWKEALKDYISNTYQK